MISIQLSYTDANNWCIGANEGNTGCDCTETNSSDADYCSINDVAKIMSSATQTHSSMLSHESDTTFTFDPVRGTMASADLVDVGGNPPKHGFVLESDNTHWQLTIDIGPTGRIRVCNDDSDKAVPGFQTCPVSGVVVFSLF